MERFSEKPEDDELESIPTLDGPTLRFARDTVGNVALNLSNTTSRRAKELRALSTDPTISSAERRQAAEELLALEVETESAFDALDAVDGQISKAE